LNDPHVGKALRLLHANPVRDWTVEELAREVAVSRSVLAQRFTELVGEAPMKYLASWRMQLAKQMMREGVRNIQDVATVWVTTPRQRSIGRSSVPPARRRRPGAKVRSQQARSKNGDARSVSATDTSERPEDHRSNQNGFESARRIRSP
jgi:hypothetical protein